MKTSSSVPRRGVLVGGTAAAITGLFVANSAAASAAPAKKPGTAPKPKLKFAADGKFKIVQFNDTQDGPRTDRRTLELMDKVLDTEKPGFAALQYSECNHLNPTPRIPGMSPIYEKVEAFQKNGSYHTTFFERPRRCSILPSPRQISPLSPTLTSWDSPPSGKE